MRTRCCLCLLALGVVLPGWCLAQPAPDGGTDQGKVEQEQNEDVEVLRQLLTETVEGLYRWPQERLIKNCASCHMVSDLVALGLKLAEDKRAGPFRRGRFDDPSAWDPHRLIEHHKINVKANVSSLANYVPGHGIVVQLEAPPPLVKQDVKAWVIADESAPSRWDILLRGLRGESEKNPPLWPQLLGHEYRRVHRLELTEKVVDVLVENGRNLRHLAADEHVTVAFTFRAPEKDSKESARTTLLRHYEAPVRDGAGEARKDADRPPPTAAGPTSMAGDLQLAQGQFAEAVAAYEGALKRAGVDFSQRKEPVPPNAVPLVKSLIQAHVGAGTDENWSQATKLHEWLKRSQTSREDELTFLRRAYLDITGVAPTPEETKAYLNDARPNRREVLLERLLAIVEGEETPSRFPSRMVVSCTKKQLDEVASGKMSKLDFGGKIMLKYYKPTPSDSKQKVPHHKK